MQSGHHHCEEYPFLNKDCHSSYESRLDFDRKYRRSLSEKYLRPRHQHQDEYKYVDHNFDEADDDEDGFEDRMNSVENIELSK